VYANARIGNDENSLILIGVHLIFHIEMVHGCILNGKNWNQNRMSTMMIFCTQGVRMQIGEVGLIEDVYFHAFTLYLQMIPW